MPFELSIFEHELSQTRETFARLRKEGDCETMLLIYDRWCA